MEQSMFEDIFEAMENLESFPNSLRYFEKLYNISKIALKKYSFFGKGIGFSDENEENFIRIRQDKLGENSILLQTIIKKDSIYKHFSLEKSIKNIFDDYIPQEKGSLNLREKINKIFYGKMRPSKLVSFDINSKPLFDYDYILGNYVKVN